MMQQSNQMSKLIEQIRRDPSLVERMSSQEGSMVRAALDGKSVYEIASDCQTSEANVWHVLGRAAREASGAELHPVETGGLGSLGDEPDPPLPGEPDASGAGQRQERPAQMPQTPHPSQAEGADAEDATPVQTPQTRHPSQAEGDEESVDESLRAQERDRQ
jgi:hypothetical protein